MDKGNSPGDIAKRDIAKRAIGLLDLTNLNDDCSPDQIEDLCKRASTPFGKVAAICIWPSFVVQAKELLQGSGIRIATVVNFPAGGTAIAPVVSETRKALDEGADEIDMVLPWAAFLNGEIDVARNMVEAVRMASQGGLLKVILETGKLKDENQIRLASRLAIAAGADFIKTSTGKVEVNATPSAARIMLEEIAASGKPVGFKPAGGMKTTADAAAYLALADDIMGADWATPATFRFGASSVLNDLLAVAQGDKGGISEDGGEY